MKLNGNGEWRRGLACLALGALTLGTSLAAEIQFRALSLERGYPKGKVYLHTGSEEPGVEVNVKSFLNHQFEKVEVGGKTLIFSSDPDPASLKDAGTILGRLEFPKAFRSGIFLFQPGEKGKGGTVRLIDDTARSFPPGSVKVLNLSASEVRITLEGKTYQCPAQAETVIKDPPVRENQSSGMRAFRKEGDEWVQVVAGMWPHPGKKRVLQVLTNNARTGNLTMQGVRDIAEAP